MDQEQPNPWRDAIIAALKARNRYFEHAEEDPVAMLEDLLREAGYIAAHKMQQRLNVLDGIADQLIETGLAINAAREPQDRSEVLMEYSHRCPGIADDVRPAIEAWSFGCMIQSRYRNCGDEWRDVSTPDRPCTPNFLHPMLEYRVKPDDGVVTFDDSSPVIKYQPPPPLDWSDSSDAATGAGAK